MEFRSHLASITAATFESGAHENIRHVLGSSSFEEHVLALVVADDRHRYLQSIQPTFIFFSVVTELIFYNWPPR